MSDIVERLNRKYEIAAGGFLPVNPDGPEAAAEITRLRDEVERLRGDLARFDADTACEGCGAPLYDGDDYVTDPEGVAGCWSTMTDVPSKRERPCFAYRVGSLRIGRNVARAALDG